MAFRGFTYYKYNRGIHHVLHVNTFFLYTHYSIAFEKKKLKISKLTTDESHIAIIVFIIGAIVAGAVKGPGQLDS